jgi:glycyl-tRNA synthetase
LTEQYRGVEVEENNNLMEKIVSLCKRRGFIFPGSQIYGGLGGTWDFGPLGVELKKNVKEAWWKSLIYERDDILGLDASIIMHPSVWEASGHLQGFSDPLVDCKECKKRFKYDIVFDKCSECGGELSPARQFNLMFKTFVGPVEDAASVAYLRPETAQGIFVNFENIATTMRKKIPFGIAQYGKAFRNEITIGNFIFRSREFEQMEIEFFVQPGEDEKWHQYWLQERLSWYERFGIKKQNLKVRRHEKKELAHYAKDCYDIEYLFPMGTCELEGIANRTDFDLKQHSRATGKDFSIHEEQTNQKFLPFCIEPSGGVDRAVLAFLIDAYTEEVVKGEKRVLLNLHPFLAPVKVAVLPLLRNRPEIVEEAKKIKEDISGNYYIVYDDTGSIGRLYRRQDEIGTPYCVTVDVQSLEDKKVTVRDRCTMQQERISIERLKEYLDKKLEWKKK